MTDEELNQRFERIESKIRFESISITMFIIVWTLLLTGFICTNFTLMAR